MKFSNKVYDTLKWICLTAIPASIVFLNVVLPSCGVSAEVTKTVMAVIGAVATFIGSLIGISSSNYNNEVKDELVAEEIKEEIKVSLADDEVEFHGKVYKKTGKSNQILASYAYSDEEYDYVEYLYGDGKTDTKKSKGYKTDEEREERYNYITEKYPDRYPVKWSYDTELTLAQNFTIAKGQKTKEDFIK